MPERNIFSFKINTNSINKRSANLMFNTANPMVNNQTCNINYSQCRTIDTSDLTIPQPLY